MKADGRAQDWKRINRIDQMIEMSSARSAIDTVMSPKSVAKRCNPFAGTVALLA